MFLRLSSVPSLKLLSLGTAVAGVAAIAWPSATRGAVLWRSLAGALFVGFVVQAAWRYTGILKDELGPPFQLRDLALLGAQASALFAIAVVSAHVILRLATQRSMLKP